MAKNWTLGEALTAIKEYDKAAIADFGKRFPLATMALMEAKAGETLINAIPDRVTMRKIEMALKEGVDTEEADDIDDVAEDEAEMTPKKAGRPKKGTAKTDEEKKAAAKARREARKAKKAAAMNEPEDDEEDEESGEDYSEMNAVELFKLCKKRGLTAQPKKPSKYYIDLLKADDSKVDDDEDEGDDWEDEEEEAPAPKKGKAGRPKKEATKVESKKSSKAKAKPEPEEDDEDEEDDWDI